MSNKYESPIEVTTLEAMLSGLAYRNGFDLYTVFDDLLRYIVGYFSIEQKPLDSWRYTKEQNAQFWAMLQEWIRIMGKQSNLHGWYDAFGDIYMSVVSGKRQQQYHGQFFTPIHICDLMTSLQGDDGTTNKQMNDPCCGSSRFLLSFHVKHPTCYLVGEDIDYTCCLMTACNFIIHGCRGHIIWHNSLAPDSFNGGWAVNELLPIIGLPSIRPISESEYHGESSYDLIGQVNKLTQGILCPEKKED